MSRTGGKFGSVGPRSRNAGKQEGKRAPSVTDEEVSSNGRPSNNVERDHPGANRWWKSFTNDLGMFILTLATLIALGIYTWYTRQLVIDTETSYTVVQRAFVTALPIQVDPTIVKGERAWMFTTIVENSGATPTKGMNFHQYKPCFKDATGKVNDEHGRSGCLL